MTDRELLEAAAKAAGIELEEVIEKGVDAGRAVKPEGIWWSPLHDDGEALRLAVKLNLSTDVFVDVIIVVYTTNDIQCDHVEEPVGTDPLAATRRAITRAAAEIGRQT